MQRPAFVLVGPGRLGGSLVERMRSAGWTCTLIRCRDAAGVTRTRRRFPDVPTDHWNQPGPWPSAPLVMVTVPDRFIPAVASSLSGSGLLDNRIVLHTSGLEDSTVLAPCRDAGASIGSWHPLQCFPASGLEAQWEGVPCAIEGDLPAVNAGRNLARQLGMRPWQIDPQNKPLYHAAAAVAANLPYVLIAVARKLIDRCGPPGMPPPDALDTLVRTSVDAALTSRGLEGMTGPLARGDEETVRRHLEALPPEVGTAYRAVAELLSNRFADPVFD